MFLSQDIRTESEFEAALQKRDISLYAEAYALSDTINTALEAYRKTKTAMESWQKQVLLSNDINQQLDCLFYQGFARHVSTERLQRFPKFLSAIQIRLEKAFGKIDKDAQLSLSAKKHEDKFWLYADKNIENPENEPLRWMLEEFRISLFAQQIKTAHPISEKRLEKAWQALNC